MSPFRLEWTVTRKPGRSASDSTKSLTMPRTSFLVKPWVKDFVAGRVRPAVAEGALFRNPAPPRRTSKFDSPRYLRYELNDKVDGQGLVLFCFPFDVVRPGESVREIMRRMTGR